MIKLNYLKIVFTSTLASTIPKLSRVEGEVSLYLSTLTYIKNNLKRFSGLEPKSSLVGPL